MGRAATRRVVTGLALGLVLGLAAALAGCGEDDKLPQQLLAGTWDGGLEDAPGIMHDATLIIGSDGNIASLAISGADQGFTATLTQFADTNFAVNGADGTRGVLFADRGRVHLLYADDQHRKAALRIRPGDSTDMFTLEDFAGQWLGTFATVNEGWGLAESGSVVASGQDTGDFGATNSAGTTTAGTVELTSGLYGRYTGDTFTADLVPGRIRFILTPDKRFLGSYNCTTGGTYPQDCEFNMWIKVDFDIPQ